MPENLHGFKREGARRVVAATRGWENRLRNLRSESTNPGVAPRGFWARLQAIVDDDKGELAGFYDAASESYSWIRQIQDPDGKWEQHPLVNVPGRERCGFHRAFAPDLAAAFEVNRILTPEDSIVWMRPGAQDEIDGEDKPTRCYLFEAPGGEHWWYAALTSRCERAYSWTELAPQSIAWPKTVWAQCTDPQIFGGASHPRAGILNAFDINGAAHNCQGGVQPKVVRMWQGGMVPKEVLLALITAGYPCIPAIPIGDNVPKAYPYFLMDFDTTNECDGERKVFP